MKHTSHTTPQRLPNGGDTGYLSHYPTAISQWRRHRIPLTLPHSDYPMEEAQDTSHTTPQRLPNGGDTAYLSHHPTAITQWRRHRVKHTSHTTPQQLPNGRRVKHTSHTTPRRLPNGGDTAYLSYYPTVITQWRRHSIPLTLPHCDYSTEET